MGATIEERRRVAKRLRGLNGNISHVRRVYEAEGLPIFCDDQADYYQICDAVAGYLPAEHMHPCDYEELHARLADLIDPCDDPSSQCHKVSRQRDEATTADTTKPAGDTTICDRDALLALADELEDTMRDGGYSARIARRIREACGEKEEL